VTCPPPRSSTDQTKSLSAQRASRDPSLAAQDDSHSLSGQPVQQGSALTTIELNAIQKNRTTTSGGRHFLEIRVSKLHRVG
jgi:hypothetical protein